MFFERTLVRRSNRNEESVCLCFAFVTLIYVASGSVHPARLFLLIALSKIYENKMDYEHVHPLTGSPLRRVTDVAFLIILDAFFYLAYTRNLVWNAIFPFDALFFTHARFSQPLNKISNITR